MRETINWYSDQSSLIESFLDGQGTATSLPFPVHNKFLVGLDEPTLLRLYNFYPQHAQQRFAFRHLVGQLPNWFSQDSLKQSKPIPTTNVKQAISNTAIIPSYITGWIDPKNDKHHDIWLYNIRKEDVTSPLVRRIILSQGFVHELAHTIVNPAVYYKDYKLVLPDGTTVDGLKHVLGTFGELAEQHPPISHYSSAYRNGGSKFDTKTHGDITPANEELSECIAAYLLGFVYCEDESRRFSPFSDRPQISSFVSNFLHATAVE